MYLALINYGISNLYDPVTVFLSESRLNVAVKLPYYIDTITCTTYFLNLVSTAYKLIFIAVYFQ